MSKRRKKKRRRKKKPVRNITPAKTSNNEMERKLPVDIRYYKSHTEIGPIKRLMDIDLSEPYSIYTYRYFINNWPKLCLVCWDKEKIVGSVICKVEEKRANPKRGYIAMLVVDKPYRGKGIGSVLVQRVIKEMKERYNVGEVVLETEVINFGALKLYENLGFMRTKKLSKYYLNGGDAYRLILYCDT